MASMSRAGPPGRDLVERLHKRSTASGEDPPLRPAGIWSGVSDGLDPDCGSYRDAVDELWDSPGRAGPTR